MNLKKIFHFQDYLNAYPFSILHSKFWSFNIDVSDFFSFRLDGYETIFIAENSLALLIAQPISCHHIFHFFDTNGTSCGIYEVDSKDFHYKLVVDQCITNGVIIGGFTHNISYSKNIQTKYKDLLKKSYFQHRGYTGYKKIGKSIYSYVHGNFGGMYFNDSHNIKSLARLRKRHIYTPQFSVKPDCDYDFIFSNPTNKNTRIRFLLIDGRHVKILDTRYLSPYSTNKFTFCKLSKKNDCNVAWEVDPPIGRCVVFENNSDVFHS
jgi:hypothetical protein